MSSWLLIPGLVALVLGAELLVRGGSGLARRWGVPSIWIGLTIVAVGTSAPEFVVSLTASIQGRGDVALGNVMGSNILNVLLVLGATACMRPVLVQRRTVRQDVPFVVLASSITLILALNGVISQIDGAILLLGFVAYVYYLYRQARRRIKPARSHAGEIVQQKPMILLAAMVILGLVGLILGGQWLVEGGTDLARQFGLSDRIIGLTVVAIGTSSPELAASLVAAYWGDMDMAVGNIVGSNLLNLLLVLGGAAAFASLLVSPSALIDVIFMAATALFLWRAVWTGHQVARWEGFLMLGLYGAYLWYLIA